MTNNIGQLSGSQDAVTVRFFGDPYALAADLSELHGHTFMRVLAIQDMEETDAKGQLKRMKKRGNPFLGRGVTKYTDTQVTANFDYASKVERRDGDPSATKGNWSQAVIINGKLTPLSIHKSDILTELTTDPNGAKLDDDGNIVNCLGNCRAILDESESIQIATCSPRLYLRVEIIRESGDKPRDERKMRSTSVYLDRDKNEIPSGDIKPYLKSRGPRTDETDMQVFSLGNVIELRAGGVIYRKADAQALAENFPKPQVITN